MCVELFIIVLYYFFDVYRLDSDIPYFIPNIGNLSLFFFLVSPAGSLSIFEIFLKSLFITVGLSLDNTPTEVLGHFVAALSGCKSNLPLRLLLVGMGPQFYLCLAEVKQLLSISFLSFQAASLLIIWLVRVFISVPVKISSASSPGYMR